MTPPSRKSSIVNRQSSIATTTGTREWAASTANCCLGCAHGCLYCYARHQALRFGRIKRPEDWTIERLNYQAIARGYGRRCGVVMFPSTHDITPGNLDACRRVLSKLLAADNRVLVVSKPHADCIRDLSEWFGSFAASGRLRFRFTIGTLSESLAAFWEPHAPEPRERIECLKIARKAGFQTSVSCEPLLAASDGPLSHGVAALLFAVDTWVTETIWIGRANHLRQRTAWALTPEHRELRALEAAQSDQEVRAVYRMVTQSPELREVAPKIRWKDSYRKVLGLPAETVASSQ